MSPPALLQPFCSTLVVARCSQISGNIPWISHFMSFVQPPGEVKKDECDAFCMTTHGLYKQDLDPQLSLDPHFFWLYIYLNSIR